MSLPLEAQTDFHGCRCAGIPERLKPIGWLAMISLADGIRCSGASRSKVR